MKLHGVITTAVLGVLLLFVVVKLNSRRGLSNVDGESSASFSAFRNSNTTWSLRKNIAIVGSVESRDESTVTGEKFSNGVVLTTPSANNGFPSFQIDGLEDSLLPYARVTCSDRVIKNGHKVPNIIHYVWFGKFRISLVQYYAIRSAALIQKPYMLIFHMDHKEPIGPFWDRLKSEVPCIRIVKTVAPTKIFSRRIKLVEHKSDVARINILLKYGGIYSDVNVVFVRPMDALMVHSVVLGKEEDRSYGNSFILSERNASFVQIWRDSYISFDYHQWSDHSTVMPMRLHKMFPHIPLHVEQYSMMRPNYMDGAEWLSHNNWDLRYNYCVHLYVNEPHAKKSLAPMLKLSESDLVTLDNTFGQLIRISLFGTPYFMVDDIDIQLLRTHSPLTCAVKKSSQDGLIPKILHYVWNGEKLLFHHYLSIRSAIRAIHPSAVYFHAVSNKDPLYYSYLAMVREITCLKIVNASHLRDRDDIYSRSQHLRNILPKLRVLRDYGGIVLDFNTTILRPLDDLLKRDLVIGTIDGDFDYSVMMAKSPSTLARAWLEVMTHRASKCDEALISVLQKADDQLISLVPDLITVPGRTWFYREAPDIPSSRAMSFRKSGLDMDYADANEKTVLKRNDFLGIIARLILLENAS